jgi:hypothetical protein
VAAKPSAARVGTLVVMKRLYRLGPVRTIELLVMRPDRARWKLD